jgi:hypothetical protein
MAVYRFRVMFEDNEDIQRDIEIKSNQTFLDFHNCIQESIKFDNKHAASFFVSDDYWRKNLEVTLLEADKDNDNKLMATTKIATCIEKPYQRFVYLFDVKVQWTLLIELIKILPDNEKVKYPVCSRSAGNPPKQYKLNIVAEGPISPDVAMANMLADDELDKEAYKIALEPEMGLDEDDLNFTSEEGEEGHEDELAEETHDDEEHDTSDASQDSED